MKEMKKDKKWVLDKLNKIEPFEFRDGYRLGFETGIKRAKTIVEKLDEPEKVVIPKFVAEYVDLAKSDVTLMRVLEIANRRSELPKWKKEYDWISANDEAFARAWLYGYEVEKEKLYRIILPKRVSKKWTYCFIDRDLEVQYTHVLSAVTTHTEEQIEAYDEIYQELAVEVAE